MSLAVKKSTNTARVYPVKNCKYFSNSLIYNTMSKKLIIAIDGPAGSGKSTTAKLLANKLKYLYLDTGAMYRVITYLTLKHNIIDNEEAIVDLLNKTEIELAYANGISRVFADKVDLSEEIRSLEVNNKVSDVSTIKKVREILVEKQRQIGAVGGIVMEGRDIGTVVFPHADVKFFLTATIDERTKRRTKEMKEKGKHVPEEIVKASLLNRDTIDSTRTESPLQKADDAIIVDTSSLTIDEQVDFIYEAVSQVLKINDSERRMIVTVDKYAGFCWGVVRAIDYAEKELQSSNKLYSLGDVIHNAVEVNRLAKLGLKTISAEDFSAIPKGSKVLIRAHGEPPLTYKKAVEYGIELIDATCPVVTKVQERIKKFVDKNYQVVIFGKKDHAEVIGLRGVTGDKAVIILNVAEALERVDLSRPTVLFSQTTMDKETFASIASALKAKVKELVIGTIEEEAAEFHAKDTICGQVSGREKKLREFALSNDVVIFTAGKKSSNGKVLFNVAKEVNEKTFFVESKEELDFSWFTEANSVGITGATSTPKWVMDGLKSAIENRVNK